MQKSLALKLFSVGVLILLLLVPLKLIEGLISARQHRQMEVEQTIAASAAHAQTATTPFLVVRYIEQVTEESWSEPLKRYRTVTTPVTRTAMFTPIEAKLEVITDADARFKGLYKAQVLKSESRWRLRFEVPAMLGTGLKREVVEQLDAWIAIGLSDARGIIGAPEVTWNGSALTVHPGTGFDRLANGLHASVGKWPDEKTQSIEASVKLNWIGTGALNFAPLGQRTQVTLHSPWPHPNFQGSFLPVDKTIGDAGFRATWDVTHYASQNDRLLQSANPVLENFGVRFIEPVNIYLTAERAVKYGILFVALTFAAFFLIEILKGAAMHPLQYGLVGLALAVFFLLIVSLSEHLAFGAAYLAASVACVGLMSFYISHVLNSRRRGLGFGALFGLLYLALYGLLLSEDNALVLGTLLLFAALATVMVLTRKVDWFRLGEVAPAKNASD
ncbi:MAG: cell envelope integrity protein CreD [Betaproteobacteria bacterium]|nr:cell envelope integrity protein CreD [Betaproteobacteria bacterium]